MKHSSPIKYPVNFLVICLGLSLLVLISVVWFTYTNWAKSRSSVDGPIDQIVVQLNWDQYKQASEILQNKK